MWDPPDNRCDPPDDRADRDGVKLKEGGKGRAPRVSEDSAAGCVLEGQTQPTCYPKRELVQLPASIRVPPGHRASEQPPGRPLHRPPAGGPEGSRELRCQEEVRTQTRTEDGPMRTQGGDGHLRTEESSLRRPALPTPGPQTSRLLTQKANVYCGSRPSEPLVTAVSANSSTENAEKGFLGTAGRTEKDTTAAHRRHQLGPGAPPSAVSPGHLKAASGMAELQRIRCVGGLHQKGDPPSCIKMLCKELEPEGHGKDLRSDTEDAHCQASPEEQRQDAAGQVQGRWKEAEPEASGQEEPDGREGADKRALEAEEGEPESVQLGDLLEKEKPSVFVEVDLGDGSEEVITCAMKEEKRSQMDMGDLSEDEIGTSWVCCIPYSTRKKVEESS
ncbi:uncharacterized protein C13orf46 homolog [Phocoena sinus]|uniref:uncharacterized protein C13orf46 homolog n=1 Tax=Phocoena sinus TaxID=42100 RepID=UPI0013C40535|nr:uncharacterized protein C13orf46 homolog [Phocoena sinus]